MVPKTNACLKGCDGRTKWMYFLIEDDELLEKYDTIRDKVSAEKKNLIVNFSMIKNFLETKTISHGSAVLDFFHKEIPKVNCNHTLLEAASLDSARKKDENYYLQAFLK